jgi:2'-5' RNA ligase
LVTHRLFVAVWPPDEVLDAVSRLERPAIEGVRWTGREHWHVTLRFLGPVSDVEPVRIALAGLAGAAPMGPVRASVGPAVGRFDQRILHVPVAGLGPLAAAVTAATASLGRPPEDREFHGHITLARVAKGAKVDLRALAGASLVGAWDVEGIGLVESRLSPGGARYEVLERFPVTNR